MKKQLAGFFDAPFFKPMTFNRPPVEETKVSSEETESSFWKSKSSKKIKFKDN